MKKKVIKKLNKYANYNTLKIWHKILIFIFYLFFLAIILVAPLALWFIINFVLNEILNINFTDNNITNIAITIFLSLVALDIAIVALTKSQKDYYYLGKRLNRNIYFESFKKTWYLWIILGIIGFISTLISQKFNLLTNYSIVLSLFFLFKIVCEIIAINKSDADLYYFANYKMTFLKLPFVNRFEDHIDKFYALLLSSKDKLPAKLFSDEYIVIREIDRILAFLKEETDDNKSNSYLELIDRILKQFRKNKYYELSLLYYIIILDRVKTTIILLKDKGKLCFALKLFDIYNQNYFYTLQDIFSSFTTPVLKFINKNINEIRNCEQLKIIMVRINVIALLMEKYTELMPLLEKLFEDYNNSIYVSIINESLEKSKTVMSQIEKQLNSIKIK